MWGQGGCWPCPGSSCKWVDFIFVTLWVRANGTQQVHTFLVGSGYQEISRERPKRPHQADFTTNCVERGSVPGVFLCSAGMLAPTRTATVKSPTHRGGCRWVEGDIATRGLSTTELVHLGKHVSEPPRRASLSPVEA